MVLATHIIFTAYGFWLPNDPRGSWSEFVAAWELLLAAGKATKVTTRQSLAHRPHDPVARQKAKEKLSYTPVRFTGRQALAVARGFKQAVEESAYELYACSILHDHVHVVARRHEHEARRIAAHLKGRASQRMFAERLHPFQDQPFDGGTLPTPWVRNCWRVFLDSPADVARAISYVEQNPVKEGLKRQSWSFVRGLRT
jgi:REP element-mobilizing transposase RayT